MGQDVNISFAVKNSDGSKFSDAAVNYYNVSEAGVVGLEELQLGVLNALHAKAEAKVAAAA